MWNTVALEGNPLSRDQVQRILIDEAAAPSAVSDPEVQQVQDCATAFQWLLTAVKTRTFTGGRRDSDRCNQLLVAREALNAGHFRSGEVGVELGHRGRYRPPASRQLEAIYAQGMAALATIGDPVLRAMVYFPFAARSQFYFDGNKRTARMIMNGHLLSAGAALIDVPMARKADFDRACVTMFADGDATEILAFLAECQALP
ncbi:cell filamentation protein Fic [Gordonia sihwensis]|uniref:cell filamentation protein Fic n=1 Tax=Gordonia sihwensis TaxID=173559 RepID=UPI003D96FA9C